MVQETTTEEAPNVEEVDARTTARRASTSSSTAAGAAGRQVAVLKEDPRLDSAGNRYATPDQLKAFLKVSGYKEAQVMGSSEARRTFSTDNGGKYLLSKKGTNVRVISGPPTPKQQEEAEEGAEEE